LRRISPTTFQNIDFSESNRFYIQELKNKGIKKPIFSDGLLLPLLTEAAVGNDWVLSIFQRIYAI